MQKRIFLLGSFAKKKSTAGFNLFRFSSYFIIVLFCFLSTEIFAQVTTSSISGIIKSNNNQTVSSASIELIHLPTGTKYGLASSTDGRFRVGNLIPGGPYKITISFVGYQKEERDDVFLILGADQQLDFEMKPEGNQLTEVTVLAGRKDIRNGAGTRVGKEQIRTMPSLSRSIPDMTKLTPQNNNNSFVGTNFRYNNVTIDGAINNDAIGFSPSLGGQSGTSGMPGSSTRTNPVSLDAIQDIQVYLAPFDIKIGNFLGGSVNAVTRSGTNQFEGSIYGFGRNASLVGPNNAGDKSKIPSDFHDYQTGFRAGFPLIKDKLFFFTNEEITRRQDPVILAAGSSDVANVIDLASAQKISDYLKTNYQIDPGTYNNTSIYSNSNKFFNRIDWNINSKNQLTIRNNTVTSKATNLERDQQNFRFGSIDYRQINNQNSTVAELKSRFSNTVSNSLVLGYSTVHDYREPASDPRLPQVQIVGLKPGTTIFLGSDREGTIFDMRQKTFEFTDNLTFSKGKNTFTVGTHNELYNIQYGFVNSWNGRVDYNSIDDFLHNKKPSRVRGNYNYTNNTRDYIMGNPPASFHVNMYSLYGQDEIRVNNRLRITPGLRFDLASVPNKQPLSNKTTESPVDPNYATTYTHTQAKDIQNKFLGNVMVSPRLGFNYDVNGNRSLIIRGGTGVFTGRIPFAWLGYSFYNNGETYGAYDQRSNTKPFAAGSDPLVLSDSGIARFARQNGAAVSDKTKSTQVDLIDNKFKMPSVWRSDLALDFNLPGNYKLTLEGIYTKVINDLKFQQINIVDKPVYYPYDVNHQQPIYPSGQINPLFTNAYLLSNTKEGYRYSITAQLSKTFPFGLDVMAAYTYGHSKDITNGIRNSMESNWQLNQALNPNEPGLANSNFDVRQRIVSVINEKLNWNKKGKFVSTFTVFVNAQSGNPFTWGFLNATVQNTPQQVSLAYIPKAGETVKLFADNASGTAAQQAQVFDAFIDGNSYLKTRRGEFTERNGGRTPWNTTADFRFTQDFNFMSGKKKNTISLTFDILNLTNLLNSEWGHSYFSPNTFNSTASVGLKTAKAGTTSDYPVYTFSNPGIPYSTDFFASRYQMQFGLRYTF